jgi:N-acetylglucosamine kinase-like BadF-type ATPase
MRVLGVDGGQTGIRLRASDGDRTVEVDGVGRLEGDAVERLADAIARGFRQGAFAPPDRVVLGLTTAPADRAEAGRLGALVAASTGAAEAWVADDAVTAHAGALSGGWGVGLVAGTGVACMAMREGGEARILGGHGFLLGDEGGGYWIGRSGLAAALRALEGRGPATALTAAATRRYGPLDDLPARLHEAARPVPEIAAFTPDVLEAAAGDPVAASIVDAAADELATTALAGVAWASGGSGAVPVVAVALGGRLLAGPSILRTALEARLAAADPSPAVRQADGSPLDGALRLGLGTDPGPYHALVTIVVATRPGIPA